MTPYLAAATLFGISIGIYLHAHATEPASRNAARALRVASYSTAGWAAVAAIAGVWV